MTHSFQLSALACACLATLSFSNAWAQNAAPGVPSEIVITGNPLGRDSTTVPVSTLGRADLLERGQSTLGETLSGLPGVSSTYFGPSASRPIIRGLDGDRIRVLNNSASSLDASALSYDHAVPLDVLSTDRIEVLRGPAALLYGGSAVGGVVNVIDNRIPRAPISGVLGRAQLQAGTGNDERSVAGLVEAGNERFALHLDGFDRRTGDVRVPVSLDCTKPGSPANARRICNSASTARGGALGASTFWDHGFLGASVNSYQSDYGTVAEDQVTIGMKTTRYALEGQVRQLPGWFESVKARLSHTDYQHTEFEGTQAGTVFANKGQDLRIEARHRPLAGWQGVVGVQTESSRFSAVGDEAFAPFSRTRSQALFVHEELPTAWGQVTAGARWESVRVESLGNPELDRFDEGIGAKKFTPFSVAAGAVFKLSPTWSFTGNAAVTQRAPKDYELFANGPHLATHAWEIGNKDLGLEKSKSLDGGLAWKSGPNRMVVTAFASQFANYIGLMNTGDYRDEEGKPVGPEGAGDEGVLPLQLYQGVRAKFQGLEVNGRQRLWQKASTLDLDWRADTVRATNSSTGEPLPRISPMRVGATLVHSHGPWSAKLGADWHAAQKRVPDGSRSTVAYTLVNASVSYRQKLDTTVLQWFARLDNLTDQLAYSASSILTSTAFGKSPLPGRSFKLGVQASF
ncbi:TonB-dependent receptor [Limnohabitans planktonicus]|uniref:Ligand-gated channel protein n=1 Tax=Limnohabitans planktonicus II-D5 TaxID=1293045 RepID=A0A2T7UFL5_9BURK|nr:TonB-dependent receptor [Limnohabitans planktonicus]PVE43483.1 ligand-gated channel protein [Limnohabitans planktonicus II-D5]|eukprot:gene22201-28311_t